MIENSPYIYHRWIKTGEFWFEESWEISIISSDSTELEPLLGSDETSSHAKTGQNPSLCVRVTRSRRVLSWLLPWAGWAATTKFWGNFTYPRLVSKTYLSGGTSLQLEFACGFELISNVATSACFSVVQVICWAVGLTNVTIGFYSAC